MNRPWGFEQFCEKYGEDAGTDVLERIDDAMWDKTPNDRIRITQRDTLNGCGYVIDGDIEYAGKWFSFSVESGKFDGTQVLEWTLVCAADTEVNARIDAYERARAALSKAKGEGQ